MKQGWSARNANPSRGSILLWALACCAALGVATPGHAVNTQPAPAIAAVFNDVCFEDTETAFASFEKSAARWGFEREEIYWVNEDRDTFQLHEEDGLLFCVFFYVREASDVKAWTRTMMTEIYPPSASVFDARFKDGRYIEDIGLFSRMPIEHKVMYEQDGFIVYRIMVGVPE